MPFFQDIPIPDGTLVHELEDGIIVKSYVAGAPLATSIPRAWLWIALLATIMVITGIVVYRRAISQ
jgi:hypothetical protein